MTTAAPPPTGTAVAGRGARALLVFCAVAVAFAAIDTYVVVLVLPDMLVDAHVGLDNLQRGAPIISGFLLGYVAMLPLIGRICDLRGPVPVLAASLVAFAIGSTVTAASYDLTTMVAGRFLQGVGGGGLVPATISLVGVLYPVERRGLPLGVVSAVQELGAVLGPLYGALVLTFGGWRDIFAINVAVGLALAVVVRTMARRGVSVGPLRAPDPAPTPTATRGGPDLIGLAGLLVALVAAGVVFLQPAGLRGDLTWGRLFIPYTDGGGRWVTPLGVATAAGLVVLVARCLFARRPLVDVRTWWRSMVDADLGGALALAAVLAGIILAFASADPKVAVLSDRAPWFLLGSAVAATAFVVHARRTADPLVSRGTLRERPAWGALVVSLLVGWALIAALVDIPLFAQTTTERSQLGAALVLVRFLVALPVGAVLGGAALRRLPASVVAGVGLLCATGAFAVMSTWDEHSLDHVVLTTVPLLVGGLGFGLALAPVNAAMLASTDPRSHGVASALVVVARMIGMLVGISVLTVVGLHQVARTRDSHPDYSITQLGVVQEQAIFGGAAVVALLAAGLALVLLHGARTREVDVAEALRAGA